MRYTIQIPICGILLLVALACVDQVSSPSRLETRASIAGRVLLESIAGLNDTSRVRVDLGRGEGSMTVEEDGTFVFSDLEPDVYTLKITYAGGLTSDASESAYQPYSAQIVAREGGSVNLGDMALDLGVGSVIGQVTRPGGGGISWGRNHLAYWVCNLRGYCSKKQWNGNRLCGCSLASGG